MQNLTEERNILRLIIKNWGHNNKIPFSFQCHHLNEVINEIKRMASQRWLVIMIIVVVAKAGITEVRLKHTREKPTAEFRLLMSMK